MIFELSAIDLVGEPLFLDQTGLSLAFDHASQVSTETIAGIYRFYKILD